MTQSMEVFGGSVSGEINLLCVLLEEQTWTQNHILQILPSVKLTALL